MWQTEDYLRPSISELVRNIGTDSVSKEKGIQAVEAIIV